MRTLLQKNNREIRQSIKDIFPLKTVLSILAGTAILAFGMVNIHKRVHITEGGVLGMILLLNYWFAIPAALLSPLLDALCYLFGFRYLGKEFLIRSIAATLCLAGFLKLWESLPYLFPDLTEHPLIAAVAGACFVGIGVGLVVRQKASSGGDDALAMVISKLTRCKIARAYLATDITVLLLSLTYIPLGRIAYSFVTVTISSLLIDFIQDFSMETWKQRVMHLADHSDIPKKLSCPAMGKLPLPEPEDSESDT